MKPGFGLPIGNNAHSRATTGQNLVCHSFPFGIGWVAPHHLVGVPNLGESILLNRKIFFESGIFGCGKTFPVGTDLKLFQIFFVATAQKK